MFSLAGHLEKKTGLQFLGLDDEYIFQLYLQAKFVRSRKKRGKGILLAFEDNGAASADTNN